MWLKSSNLVSGDAAVSSAPPGEDHDQWQRSLKPNDIGLKQTTLNVIVS
jgi:hypothetical protein